MRESGPRLESEPPKSELGSPNYRKPRTSGGWIIRCLAAAHQWRRSQWSNRIRPAKSGSGPLRCWQIFLWNMSPSRFLNPQQSTAVPGTMNCLPRSWLRTYFSLTDHIDALSGSRRWLAETSIGFVRNRNWRMGLGDEHVDRWHNEKRERGADNHSADQHDADAVACSRSGAPSRTTKGR